MADNNVNLTDITKGKSKTIAVNFFHNNDDYSLTGWTAELVIFANNAKTYQSYLPTIKGTKAEYATFYLSSKDTAELSQLLGSKESESGAITHESRNSFKYDINLIRDHQVSKKRINQNEEIKIKLCGGMVSIVGD